MFLILYDIQSTKTRTKFAKFLKQYGRRVQYSVFEIINSPRILNNVKIGIKTQFSHLFNQGDSVLIYSINDQACVAKYGYPINEDTDLLIFD